MNPIQRIIDFASGPIELPPAVRADALRLLADTLAVGAAGAASAEAEPIARAVVGWGAGTEARSLAGGTLPCPSAAFFNAFSIHCLEWDAVHEPAVVHALSVVTAALLASSVSYCPCRRRGHRQWPGPFRCGRHAVFPTRDGRHHRGNAGRGKA